MQSKPLTLADLWTGGRNLWSRPGMACGFGFIWIWSKIIDIWITLWYKLGIDMDTKTQSKPRPRIPKGLSNKIAGLLEDRIRSGHYHDGDRLPSERELEEDLGVDRRTIRAAIAKLQVDGLLDRKPNCRPVVCAPSHPAVDQNDTSGTASLPATRLVALVMWHGGAVDYAGTAQQRVFWGMNEGLRGSGYHGVFLDVGQSSSGEYQQNAEREAAHLNYALKYGFGGVVFYSQAYNSNQELVQDLSLKMPLVLLDRLIPGVTADFVGSENRQSMADATWHLIRLGHRRIAFVTSGEYINTVQERLEGYLQALGEAFAGDAYELILNPPIINSSSWPMLESICKLPASERPTAIICVNNIEAVRVANHMSAHGISVPEDVSLIGFDNVDRTLPNGVSLTTIAQPFEEIGKAAASLILARSVDRSAKYKHLELPTKLITRESVRAVEVISDGLQPSNAETPSDFSTNRDLMPA